MTMPRGTLSEREPAGGGLLRIRLDVDAKTAATHTQHGQYLEASYEEERGYFAIASAPGEPSWDLLVRDGGGMGERLRTLRLGEEVTVTEASGPGFPFDSARGRPLILAATFSGIAAVLSTLGARIETGDAKHTFLFYGVRDRSQLGLAAELDAMRAAGVHVAICLSREHATEPGFYRGYVQDVARLRHWDIAHALIFAAGNDAMIQGMRDAAPTLGLTAADVRVNA